MNLAPQALGEEVARRFCAFHGHKVENLHNLTALWDHERLVCVQCGATLREIREHSDAPTHGIEVLTTNP